MKAKILAVDAETDGLYGSVWAIGAVVLDEHGQELDRFSGQVDPFDVESEWVRDNIVPFIHLPRHASRRQLRDAFWEFWMKHKDETLCIADVGAPVESSLFRACVEDDLETRQWNGPYPLHEVATALLCAGVDPDIDRVAYSGLSGLTKHNPVDDAVASAHCWIKAMGR